ncbi:Peptidase M20/M25/M40 family protein [Raphanus sativus]|nr:Peptidase M20/M25/M40 family protein [Raphanus sativus]
MSRRLLLALVVLLLHLCILSAAVGDEIVSRFQEYLRIDTTTEFVKGKPHILLKWVGSDPTLPALLLNSHTDVVPFEESKWIHHPLQAHMDKEGDIYARVSGGHTQAPGFWLHPIRSVYLSFVPDEEIGGHDGAEKFTESHLFKTLNVGIVLDEGLPSPSKSYRVFYGERSPWWLVIKAKGPPGHGAKLYDNSAMENLLKSIESIRRFRASQFDLLKAGGTAEGDVVSVNMAFLKAGTPSPTTFGGGMGSRRTQHVLEFKQKHSGEPLLTAADDSNPWWRLLKMLCSLLPDGWRSRVWLLSHFKHPSLLHDHNEYLGRAEYLKGIDVYVSIIKAYASYESKSGSRDEL